MNITLYCTTSEKTIRFGKDHYPIHIGFLDETNDTDMVWSYPVTVTLPVGYYVSENIYGVPMIFDNLDCGGDLFEQYDHIYFISNNGMIKIGEAKF